MRHARRFLSDSRLWNMPLLGLVDGDVDRSIETLYGVSANCVRLNGRGEQSGEHIDVHVSING